VLLYIFFNLNVNRYKIDECLFFWKKIISRLSFQIVIDVN